MMKATMRYGNVLLYDNVFKSGYDVKEIYIDHEMGWDGKMITLGEGVEKTKDIGFIPYRLVNDLLVLLFTIRTGVEVKE